jgi:23S rRNA (cytosine1962-C5)-methyltransferase
MPEIILKPGREKSILRRHPWIFSGAIDAVHGSPKIGETVEVISAVGEFLARAAYNPNSNISCRVWTWEQSEQVTPQLIENRLRRAVELRHKISNLIPSNAMRLVHGESDGLPGLILDQYGEVFVVQFLTAGTEFWKESIVDIIKRVTNANVLFDRSDVDVRQLEGLPVTTGLVSGNKLDNPVKIIENGIKILVDIINGHKTGFYLDQRDNRLLARNISSGRKVLDCFSYTGGFAVNSLAGNAKNVTLVESSANALKYARENILINNLSTEQVEFVEQDVFEYLRTLRDVGESFDVVILDPPKFAPTASYAERAARGYKDINLLAFKILNIGGYLLTFSCSGGVSEELFQKIVAGAALDAGADAVILKRLHQALDHPVALNFPEGAYLKGFLIQKLN